MAQFIWLIDVCPLAHYTQFNNNDHSKRQPQSEGWKLAFDGRGRGARASERRETTVSAIETQRVAVNNKIYSLFHLYSILYPIHFWLAFIFALFTMRASALRSYFIISLAVVCPGGCVCVCVEVFFFVNMLLFYRDFVFFSVSLLFIIILYIFYVAVSF